MKMILKAATAALMAVAVGGCMIGFTVAEKYHNTRAVAVVRHLGTPDEINDSKTYLRRFSDTPSNEELDRMGFRTARARAVQQFGSQLAPVAYYYERETGPVVVGDVIDVSFGDDPISSFSKAPKIVKVLCHARSPDFDACAAKYPTGFYDKVTGKRID